MIQLYIQGMPVKAFLQAAPGLLHMLAVAEGTSADREHSDIVYAVDIQCSCVRQYTLCAIIHAGT